MEDNGGPTDLQTLSWQSVFPRVKFKMAIAAFVIIFSYISVLLTDKKQTNGSCTERNRLKLFKKSHSF
jgi:hypothetical protein